jgi:hypothetical protein
VVIKSQSLRSRYTRVEHATCTNAVHVSSRSAPVNKWLLKSQSLYDDINRPTDRPTDRPTVYTVGVRRGDDDSARRSRDDDDEDDDEDVRVGAWVCFVPVVVVVVVVVYASPNDDGIDRHTVVGVHDV